MVILCDVAHIVLSPIIYNALLVCTFGKMYSLYQVFTTYLRAPQSVPVVNSTLTSTQKVLL